MARNATPSTATPRSRVEATTEARLATAHVSRKSASSSPETSPEWSRSSSRKNSRWPNASPLANVPTRSGRSSSGTATRASAVPEVTKNTRPASPSCATTVSPASARNASPSSARSSAAARCSAKGSDAKRGDVRTTFRKTSRRLATHGALSRSNHRRRIPQTFAPRAAATTDRSRGTPNVSSTSPKTSPARNAATFSALRLLASDDDSDDDSGRGCSSTARPSSSPASTTYA